MPILQKNYLYISTIYCPSTTGTTGTCNLILILRGTISHSWTQNKNNNNSTKYLIIKIDCRIIMPHHENNWNLQSDPDFEGEQLVNLGQK